eukprot:Colp12_sorted_trinity150504_noHs@16043
MASFSEPVALIESETIDSLDDDSGCASGFSLHDLEVKITLHKDRTMAEQGTEIGQFEGPRGMASQDGLMYVCDQHNDRIQVFAEDGSVVQIIEDHEKLIAPVHVAVTYNYIVCVHGFDQNVVSWISKDTGQIIRSRKATSFGSFGGICRSNQPDHVFVSLPEENAVVELNSTSEVSRLLRKDIVNNPGAIFLHPLTERLFVCCSKSVEVFLVQDDADFKHVTSYVGFEQPSGIAVDFNGYAVIADSVTSHLHIFDDELRLTTSYPHASDCETGTSGMAFDYYGRLWLSHASRHAILRYDVTIRATSTKTLSRDDVFLVYDYSEV